MKILSIGEILWDVIGGEDHLGGAPFNFAVHSARLGHDSWLLSAVGDDERGRRARADAARLCACSTTFRRRCVFMTSISAPVTTT